MKSEVDLSIVIPVFNAIDYLSGLITNIFESYFGEYSFEVIAVNDGSTDQSGEFLSSIAKTKVAFKSFSQTNQGPSLARKVGVDNSCGRYIVFIDCDDSFDRFFFYDLLKKAEENGFDIVETGYKRVLGKTEKTVNPKCINYSVPVERFLHNRTSMFLWDKMFRRNLFENVEFYPYYYSEDSVLLLQLYRNAKRVGIAKDIHYSHYIRSSSLTGSYKVRMIDQVKSWLAISEIAEKCKLPHQIIADYYICKYAAKNCINMRRIGKTDVDEYRLAKDLFHDHYHFFAFFALFLKREVSLKSVLGISYFRLFVRNRV